MAATQFSVEHFVLCTVEQRNVIEAELHTTSPYLKEQKEYAMERCTYALSRRVGELTTDISHKVSPAGDQWRSTGSNMQLLQLLIEHPEFKNCTDDELVVLASVLKLAFDIETWKAGQYPLSVSKCISAMHAYSTTTREIAGVHIVHGMDSKALERLVAVGTDAYDPKASPSDLRILQQ